MNPRKEALPKLKVMPMFYLLLASTESSSQMLKPLMMIHFQPVLSLQNGGNVHQNGRVGGLITRGRVYDHEVLGPPD